MSTEARGPSGRASARFQRRPIARIFSGLMWSTILLDILGPILVMIAVGAWAQWKFKLDIATLTKLNIYVFVPAFVFEKVAGSALPWDTMGGIGIICIVQCLTLGLLVWPICRLLRFEHKTTAAVMLAVMFYNSGN